MGSELAPIGQRFRGLGERRAVAQPACEGVAGDRKDAHQNIGFGARDEDVFALPSRRRGKPVPLGSQSEAAGVAKWRSRAAGWNWIRAPAKSGASSAARSARLAASASAA